MNLKEALNKEVFHLISETADELQLECYVVGGFVRDLLLHRPSSDIDVVVVGSGITMAQLYAEKLGPKAHLSVFRSFGTAQVKLDKLEVEFVGARKESYSHDSRKPIVEDGSLSDDQQRRDFTINALAICLNGKRFGELVDPFDGLTDLNHKIIRTPLDPDVTFSDDPLRMMRCLRFKSQLDFTVHPETEEALKRNSSRIQIISNERIVEELNKILLSPRPSIGLMGLHECGLLSYVFPNDQTGEGDTMWKDQFYHTCRVVDALAPYTRNLWLMWTALLHQACFVSEETDKCHRAVTNPLLTSLFRRMKLPMNYKMDYVQKLTGMYKRVFKLVQNPHDLSAARRFLFEVGENLDDLMLLCKAILSADELTENSVSTKDLTQLHVYLVALDKKEHLSDMEYPLSGKEIMEYLQLPGSTLIGKLKEKVLEAVFTGEIRNDRSESLDYLTKISKKLLSHDK